MINRPIRIGSLNTRSIFKESHHPTQKEFISFLRHQSLHIDILCLQEVSSFYLQSHLTDQ